MIVEYDNAVPLEDGTYAGWWIVWSQYKYIFVLNKPTKKQLRKLTKLHK